MNGTSFAVVRRLMAGVIAFQLVSSLAAEEVLIASGDQWRYLKGTTEPTPLAGGLPGTGWTERALDDSGWSVGSAPIGYGQGDEATVLADMASGYLNVYFRRSFNISDAAAVEALELRVEYDDGFVAYLNGAEVARDGLTGEPPAYTEEADSHDPIGLEPFGIPLDSLATGENVLAFQVHNATLASSDFAFDAELVVPDSTSFLRGDTNNDGRVSLADAHRASLGAFRGVWPPSCADAFDALDNGTPATLADIVYLLHFVAGQGPAPPSPYPTAGPDPTDGDGVSCDSYGGGAPFVDPAAELAILDAVAETDGDRTVTLTIALSNGIAIGGYSGRVSLPAGLLEDFPDPPAAELMDLTGLTAVPAVSFMSATLEDGELRFVVLFDLLATRSLPPGTEVPVLEIQATLAAGVEPGNYPLTLAEGELAEDAGGNAIAPTLRSAILRVGNSVCGGALTLASLSAPSSSNGPDSRPRAWIVGTGFTEATTFTLRGPEEIPSIETTVVSGCRAEVVFPLAGATPGSYDLVAGADEAVLVEALEVTEEVLGPVIETWITGQDVTRHDFPTTLRLRYRNVGDREVAAPLIRLVAPEEVELAPVGESFQGNELLLLAVHPGGIAGVLPPGGEGEVPFRYRTRFTVCEASGCSFPSEGCTSCAFKFYVELFTPSSSAAIDWEGLAASTAEPWAESVEELAAVLGGRWQELDENLAAIATRLSRRGVAAASVRTLFRFAVRQAYGRPSSAALGRVSDSDGDPVSGIVVEAVQDSTVVSSAVTDRTGAYAVDWLTAGAEYTIRVRGDPASGATEPIPPAGDLYLVDLTTEIDPEALPLECAACDESGLPERPLFPPAELFTPRGDHDVRAVTPLDPNEKNGTDGEGDEKLLYPREEVDYTVYFENESADAAAHKVIIEDVIDPAFDLGTFRVTDVQIGDRAEQTLSHESDEGDFFDGNSILTESTVVSESEVSTVTRLLSVTQTAPDLSEISLGVSYDRTLDPVTRTVTWTFDTIGGEPLDGFLAADDESSRQNEAHISFSIQLQGAEELQGIDQAKNKAKATFVGAPPEETNEWINHIALERPVSPALYPSPRSETEIDELDLVLQWEATGAVAYEVFLWAEGTPPPTSGEVVGESFFKPPAGTLLPDTTYRWTVVSLDAGGEGHPSEEWTFSTSESTETLFRRGDADVSGDVDITDAIFTLSYLFLGGAALPCHKAADSNDTGDVDLTDAIFLLSHLFLGGVAPPPPYEACGRDTSEDALPCSSFTRCDA